MVKFFVSIIVLGLVAFVGYHQYGDQPLTPRATLDAGVKQLRAKGKDLTPEEEQLLRVQLALSDYQATHGNAPESLNELVPKYFDSVPLDPRTGKSFEYIREGRTFRLGNTDPRPIQLASSSVGAKGGKPVEALLANDQDFVNPNQLEVDDFVYDPTGKRDPFQALDLSEPAPTGATPLERYSIGQLRVAAVMTGFNGEKKAIVEDSQGRGYTVGIGTKIGSNNGVIVEILEDTVKIVETKVDFTGREVQNAIEMKIVKEIEVDPKKAAAKRKRK